MLVGAVLGRVGHSVGVDEGFVRRDEGVHSVAVILASC